MTVTLSLNYVSPFLQRPIIHQMTFAMADNAVQTYKLICGLIGKSDKYLSSKEKSPVRILGKSKLGNTGDATETGSRCLFRPSV